MYTELYNKYLILIKENEMLRNKLLNILDKKGVYTIDEYELYIYLYNTKEINKITKIYLYPKLPESDEE
jgi:hypothetical protein